MNKFQGFSVLASKTVEMNTKYLVYVANYRRYISVSFVDFLNYIVPSDGSTFGNIPG